MLCERNEESMKYDVVIIGSGPAGISASLYTKRANLSTLIISKDAGILTKVRKIENYYGFSQPVQGEDLQKAGEEQAKRLGVEIIKEEVVAINFEENFVVETVNHVYQASNVILATGMTRNTLKTKGIKELEGKGVSYCATCDAFFYRGKEVAVIGNGDYALHELETLKPVAKSVMLLTNGEKLTENRSMEIPINEKKIREVRGIEKVEGVTFEDETTKKLDGVFIALGTASSSDLARKIGARISERNEIIVKENMETTVPRLICLWRLYRRNFANFKSSI